MEITKRCMGCGGTFRHAPVHPMFAREYRELRLVCGHHIHHEAWKRVR